MRYLVYLTILSLGLNIGAPINSANTKPGCFAIKKISCPLGKVNNNNIQSPFSCPKNPKKWDCQKKYFNLILNESKVENEVTPQFNKWESHTDNLVCNSQNTIEYGLGSIQYYDPDPPRNLPLII